MKKQPWLLFLKYPYSTAVLVCIWGGSTSMIFIDKNMPIVLMVSINIVASWIIAWFSFRPSTLK